jgi:hypothetical protein
VFTAVVVGLLAVAYLVWQRGRPREVITRGEEFAAAERAATPADPEQAPAEEPGDAVRADDHRPAEPS